MKTPRELDRVTDVVLAYRPKPKTKAANRRKRRKQYAAKHQSKGNYILEYLRRNLTHTKQSK